jgi:hypothetical protein
MSRTIQFLALRILAAAALFGASLMLPATAEAQTGGPERALLNYSVVAPYPPGFNALWAPMAGNPQTGTAEAERALLGRIPADQTATSYWTPTGTASQVDGPPVNGERALLGQRTEQ